MRDNNRFNNKIKSTIAFNVAKSIMKEVNKEVKREAKRTATRSRTAPPAPKVNPYSNSGRYQAPPPPPVYKNTNNYNNFNSYPGMPPYPKTTSSKRKTKANTDGTIAIIILLIFVFGNVIVNMLDLVISGAFNIALIAALIAGIVFLGKFISKKVKENKEKKAEKEAERFRIEEEERIKKEIAERKEKKAEEERKKNSTGNEELDKIILEGNEYIRKLKEANLAIEHEGISDSIDRMERAAKDIFDFVREHPEEIPEIKKFMNYYLPTTLKLLNSYETLSRQSVKGENIKSAMFDIEGMMETIAGAFEKQLDFLFSTQVMDLQADMTVMESILEQEGLKESDSAPKLKL